MTKHIMDGYIEGSLIKGDIYIYNFFNEPKISLNELASRFNVKKNEYAYEEAESTGKSPAIKL